MSTITAPLRVLVKEDTHFQWVDEHDRVVEKLKTTLKNSPVLQYFDPIFRRTIQADTSQHGLGACLLQKGQPVAYASRSLTVLKIITHKLKKNCWQSFSHVKNFITTYMDFQSMCSQTISYLSRLCKNPYVKCHQGYNACFLSYRSTTLL